MWIAGKGLEQPWQIKTTIVVETEFQETLGIRDAAIKNAVDMNWFERLIIKEDLTHTLKREFRHVEIGIVKTDVFQ